MRGRANFTARVLAMLMLGGAMPARSEPAVGFASSNWLTRFSTNPIVNLYGDPGYQANYSGCCLNPATGELIVVLRGPSASDYALHFYDTNGVYQRRVNLTGFDDLEAVCVVDPASNSFAVVEEGLNVITIFALNTNTTSIAKAAGRSLAMGLGNLFNVGIEGLAWDGARQCFYAVKEWQPAAVYRVTPTSSNVVTESLFDPTALTNLCVDLSDLHYDAATDRLLILSHESRRLVVCRLAGDILETLPLDVTQPEGVTVAPDRRTVYVIGEPNHFQRLAFGPLRYDVAESEPLPLGVVLSEAAPPGTTATVTVATSGLAPATPLVTEPPDAKARFADGATTSLVTVTVGVDDTFHPPRALSIILTNPVQTTLSENATVLATLHDPGRFEVSIDSLPTVGQPFRVTVTARGTNGAALTGFAGLATLALAHDTFGSRTLLAPTTTNSQFVFSTTTRGLRFTPASDLTVSHLRYAFGNQVGLWTDAGVPITNAAGPSAGGNWTEIALTPSVTLASGVTYRIGASLITSFARTYSMPLSLPATLPAATIHHGCLTNGLGFPQDLNSTAYLVDIRYDATVRAAAGVAPQTIGPFEAGQWQGWLTVTQTLTAAELMVTGPYGHSGTSARFEALAVPAVALDVPPTVREGAGWLLGAGRVTLTDTQGLDRTVALYSANTNALALPTSVVVAGGADTATFDLYVGDDASRLPAPPVALYATAPAHATGTNAVQVRDDDFERGLLLRVAGRAR